ncbi:MAG TPA: polysaccharide biosynthesis tyrosine autokinase [Blastocatellia bacterium]|nr:polysaccharide biosynthesis tyrosine autokinase [Blastocatellia bacterium]
MADERNSEEKVTTLVQMLPHSGEQLMRSAEAYDSSGQGFEDLLARLSEQWRRVRKHKWLILCIAVVITSVMTLDVFRTKSLYQATTLVEVEKENRTLFRSAEMVIEGDDTEYFYSKALMPKIRLIQSKPVLEDAAAMLKLDQNPAFLEVTKRRTTWEALLSIFGKTGSPKSNPVVPPSVRSPLTDLMDGLPVRSPAETERLAPYVGVLADGLEASIVEDTRMISISFKHTDPAMAALVADAIAKSFIVRNYRNKNQRFSDTSTWLNTRTRELKAKVEEAEKRLADYTSSHEIFSTDGKENLTIEKLGKLHAEATRAETERILKQSLYEEVRAGRVAQLPEAFADPRTAALQTRLGELATTSAMYVGKYGPDNPRTIAVQKEVVALQKQIEESRATLADRLRADYERAARDEQSLRQALERAKAETAQQNRASFEFSVLKQEVETAKSLYTDFLQKTNQVNIQVGDQRSNNNNITIIEPAVVPGSPISPNRPRTILTGLIFSLMAGIGLALLIEMLNNTIKNVEDVDRFLGLPALAVIPAVSTRRLSLFMNRSGSETEGLSIRETGRVIKIPQDRFTRDRISRNHSLMTEAYCSLRTSVMLSTAGGPPKITLVTSSQPGEGKSTTAVNMGISMAQLGGLVLIIDADLRRPTVHKILKRDRTRGLSTWLSGSVELDELIQPLEIPNLWFLPCGSIPPNPAELLSSMRMREMLKTLSQRFDHIIIDSPPVINVSDAVILSTLADGVILIIHAGKSKRSIVQRARRELSNVGARVFGVVLNRVDLKGEGYDDYYYYRYHSNYTKERNKAASAG